MSKASHTIEINLAAIEAKLRGEIASDLTALESSLEITSKPEFKNRKYTLRQGFTIAEISVPHVEFVKKREINKCFKSIMGSLQDYMDNLLAVLRLKLRTVLLPSLTTQEELKKAIDDIYKQELLAISTDRTLTAPEKIKLLLNKKDHDQIRESLQSYFDIRNGIEHHKGLAKTDRILKYKRMGLASTAGYEVLKPGPLGPDEGLVLKTFDEEIKYDKGGELIISKEQLDGLIINLLIFAIPQIQQSVVEKINSVKSSR